MASVAAKQRFLDELEREFGEEIEPEEEESEPVLSFVEFVNKVYPRYKWYRHNQQLAAILQRVADGELKRLMIFQPPRHGKSLLTSKLFPAYYLYRHPDRFAAITSYAAELAHTFSRAARDAFLAVGGKLRDDSSSVKQWETPEGGGCWAAGVGGSATGKGYSLGIIDDPLKNAEEAESTTIKRKQEDWYGSTFYTRAEPDSAIVVIQTRWAEDDLSGYLLSMEAEDEPEHWHIVNMEAIKEESLIKFPETCTIEPDWREPGEALCPERYDTIKLKRIKAKIGSRYFTALYQQRPAPSEGNLFKRDWWQFYTQLPALESFDRIIQSWDCAFKETEKSDFVVGQVWGKKGGQFYLIDQIRDRMDINATLVAVRSLTAKYPLARAKLVEDKANGVAVVDLLKRKIPGLIEVDPQGGKVVRANAVSPYMEAGNVFIPDPSIAPWVHDYIEEFASFPNGANDDAVDSTSQALIWLEKSRSATWGASAASYG